MSWNRLFSGVLVLVYVAVAFAHDGLGLASIVLLSAIFPLACIWFADAMGGYVASSSILGRNRPTPGWIVRIGGWLLLLLPLLIGVARWASESWRGRA